MKEIPSQPLQQKLRDYDQAWKNFFSDLKKFKLGLVKKVHFQRPKLKKRGCRDAFRYPQGGFFSNGSPNPAGYVMDEAKERIFLPKIGWVKYRKSRAIKGVPKSLTVSRRGTRWFVSIVVDVEIPVCTHPTGTQTGVDMGVVHTITTSNGEVFDQPDTKLLEKRLKHYQRKAGKQIKNSRRWLKTKNRIADCHRRITDTHTDFRHKTTTRLCEAHQVIVVEDLAIQNMTKSAKGTKDAPGKNVKAKSGLNRVILEQGWGEIIRLLEYKAREKGGMVIKVNPAHTS